MNTTNNTTSSNQFEFYQYNPKIGASIFFTIMFCITFIVLLILVIKYTCKNRYKVKSWSQLENARYYALGKLTGAYIPLLVGCATEIAGYIGRSVSAKNKELMGPYIEQSILLLIAPTLFAGSIYMIFGRMAYLLYEEKMMIMPAKFSTMIFVIGDIFSLFLQGAGGGVMAQENGHNTGSALVTIGLFVQIAFFGLFIINEIIFYHRIGKTSNNIPKKSKSWKSLNLILLINSILILIRSIVRVVEFLEGFSGYISSHEWFLYVFDALPMFCLTLIFTSTFGISNLYKLQEESVDIQVYNVIVDIEADKEKNNKNEKFEI
ncbi:hypothetical protein RI543_004108 [Arxiozyma heterogenica]|uniref:Uncharacterized protein n=1 Tax=Arxiozyma heterogenica TaxID=278026 RepID=A0AAN7WL11_9SACH|nr:hypothetical protein RI543_004108 [Kazachstania heterogenica]